MTHDQDARGWKARAEAAEARLKEVEKERDYFTEQSKVAQKLVGTYRARAERLREGLRWLLPLLDPMNMTPSEHEVYESLAADSAAPSEPKPAEHVVRDVCKCGNALDSGLPHPCPYDEDVNNDPTPKCKCCSACEHKCAMDI